MDGNGGVTVVFNPFNVIQRLEMLKQRQYTLDEIAKGANIHPNTIARAVKGKVRRLDLDTLEGLMNYFADEGLPVALDDLLIVTKKQAA